MITLENETLILNRTEGEDVVPLVHQVKTKVEWYLALQITSEPVLHYLIDAEILAEELPIRYIARNGQAVDVMVNIDELVSGPDGDFCRLQGVGTPPELLLGDEPQKV